MKTETELWHDYMLAAMASAPDAHPAECAGIADQCLDEYRERWGNGEESAAAARRVIAETTTDQSPPPTTPQPVRPLEMREAVALCWALAGGGMQVPTIIGSCAEIGKIGVSLAGAGYEKGLVIVTDDGWGGVAKKAVTHAVEHGVNGLYHAALTLLGGRNA